MVQVGFYNPLELIGMQPEAVRVDKAVVYDEGESRFRIQE